MTDLHQSGTGPLDCAAVEQWLAESAENTLPSTITGPLQSHAAGCAACKEKLAQARSGREWLLMLKQEPLEPPADMVAKILLRTSHAEINADLDSLPDTNHPRPRHSGKESAILHLPGRPTADSGSIPADTVPYVAAWPHSSVVVLRRTLLDPRLALVAAMAFFSISLTLNMLGFRLTGLRAADLEPSNMHRAVVRQYAAANARVVRYYENLRIVYEVEARVQQLRRAAATGPTPPQNVRPRKQSFDPAGDANGTSSKDPAGQDRQGFAANPHAPGARHTRPAIEPDPAPVITGLRQDAALRSGWAPIEPWHTLATSFVGLYAFSSAPLASSCSPGKIGFSMHTFSTRERRLA